MARLKCEGRSQLKESTLEEFKMEREGKEFDQGSLLCGR